MAIIDMHTHILAQPKMEQELKIADGNVNAHLQELDKRLAAQGIEHAHVILLDERAVDKLINIPPRLVLSLMVDFRKSTAHEMVKKAKAVGIKGIKILTYEQEITLNDHPAILRVAQEVERQGMFLTICSTFGSRKMYAHDAIALVSYLLQKGFSAPLIMAHAGGSRVREAFLLMEDNTNTYVDTSFTTTFWKGSTVIDDLAFLIKRYPDRCFFGSDAPYVEWKQARTDAEELLKKLPAELHQKLLYGNAKAFIQRLGVSA